MYVHWFTSYRQLKKFTKVGLCAGHKVKDFADGKILTQGRHKTSMKVLCPIVQK